MISKIFVRNKTWKNGLKIKKKEKNLKKAECRKNSIYLICKIKFAGWNILFELLSTEKRVMNKLNIFFRIR